MDLDLDAFGAALSSHLAGPAGDGVAAVYVHGSRVGGRPHRESDVDVGVLLRHARFPTARERLEAGLLPFLRRTAAIKREAIGR